jgi:hypothetical protein
LSENSVKLFGGEPYIAQSVWVVAVIVVALESDQTNPILYVKLQHAAAVIKSLVTVGSPLAIISIFAKKPAELRA